MTDTQVHTSRREELGGFLKACRARIGPEEVGLAPGLRRRTSGLRREEVAVSEAPGLRIQVSTPDDAATWALLPSTRQEGS
jgi:hypothetical protein